jgi:3-methyladenine DNA glycosylase AlkD
MKATDVLADLHTAADPAKAVLSASFFKTGPGQYGEGDTFIGVTVPRQRAIAAKYFRDLSLDETIQLLKGPIHEQRLTALIILVEKFNRADSVVQDQIYALYLENTAYINNWDLVDASASYIVGPYLEHRDRSILMTLAKSNSLWERRIAIVASGYFIRYGQYADTLRLATMLLRDTHDLIHKAVGWMLREVGKRDRKALEGFLATHYRTMPRTMLRYAIEHFEPEVRLRYLKGNI